MISLASDKSAWRQLVEPVHLYILGPAWLGTRSTRLAIMLSYTDICCCAGSVQLCITLSSILATRLSGVSDLGVSSLGSATTTILTGISEDPLSGKLSTVQSGRY